jgi:hypothetical protein
VQEAHRGGAGATHLFEEPGALEEVVRVARDWFVRFLVEEPAPIGLLDQPGHGAI